MCESPMWGGVDMTSSYPSVIVVLFLIGYTNYIIYINVSSVFLFD